MRSPPFRHTPSVSSSVRRFGFGRISRLIINNANGLVENVIRKMLDGFPNSLVNGGCRSSVFSLFTEKPKQTVSEAGVSPRYLQRQVRNSLKRVSVRARGPFNGLVHHGFLFCHFKKAAVFCFPLPLSSPHLDQVLHLAACFLRVAFTLFRSQIVLLFLPCYRLSLLMMLEPCLAHFPPPQKLQEPLFDAMAPKTSRQGMAGLVSRFYVANYFTFVVCARTDFSVISRQYVPSLSVSDFALRSKKPEPLFHNANSSLRLANEESFFDGWALDSATAFAVLRNPFSARQDTARTAVCACPNSPELVQLAEKVCTCT